MTTANLDERNLSAVAVGGQVHEDLLDTIEDISPTDVPFSNMIGQMDSGNHYVEWVREALEAASADNAAIDGADAGDDESVTGERIGNYHQTSTKTVKLSNRARNVNAVGSRDELLRQVTKRNRALRRDVEAALCSNNPAVAGDGTTTASKTAGIGAWLKTNTDNGATGADPTLSGGPGGYPDAGPTAGTKRAASEAGIKALLRAAYKAGGDVRYGMSVPDVIEQFSDYLFTSSARVATLQSTVPQANRQGAAGGDGTAGGGVTAQGAINVYVSNYSTMTLVPNRFQPDSSTGAADLFLIDPDLFEKRFLQGFRVQELARTGLADNRLLSVDYALQSSNEEGSAAYRDVDYALPMTA